MTRDELLREISRSLRATHPERAEELIREVEKRIGADAGDKSAQAVVIGKDVSPGSGAIELRLSADLSAVRIQIGDVVDLFRTAEESRARFIGGS